MAGEPGRQRQVVSSAPSIMSGQQMAASAPPPTSATGIVVTSLGPTGSVASGTLGAAGTSTLDHGPHVGDAAVFVAHVVLTTIALTRPSRRRSHAVIGSLI